MIFCIKKCDCCGKEKDREESKHIYPLGCDDEKWLRVVSREIRVTDLCPDCSFEDYEKRMKL
jgi:hypothetical protein